MRLQEAHALGEDPTDLPLGDDCFSFLLGAGILTAGLAKSFVAITLDFLLLTQLDLQLEPHGPIGL